MDRLRRNGPIAVFLLAMMACAPRPPVGPAGEPMERLTITTSTGTHDFWVEIADEEPERQQGLMFRPPLADDRGMLFEWPGEPPEERGFWMRNTPSSLDIVYVQADGRILSVASHATPNSDAVLSSNGAAAGVLELRAGRVDQIGAKPGDRITHPYFE